MGEWRTLKVTQSSDLICVTKKRIAIWAYKYAAVYSERVYVTIFELLHDFPFLSYSLGQTFFIMIHRLQSNTKNTAQYNAQRLLFKALKVNGRCTVF